MSKLIFILSLFFVMGCTQDCLVEKKVTRILVCTSSECAVEYSDLSYDIVYKTTKLGDVNCVKYK